MLKKRNSIPGFQEGGMNVDPVSGNEVPTGALPEEVRDDVDAKLSPGEFVIPADVVRFIGLERLMKMRDEAKKGIQRMAEIGQMGNADEVGEESNSGYEDDGFESEIDDILSEIEAEENGRDVNEQTEVMMASGGAVGTKTGQTTTAGRPVYKTEEGDNVSELSITVPFKGFWANVPSIHNGVKYDEDQIVEMLNKGKITPTSVHESIKEAVDAAKARSAGLLDKPEMAFGGYVGSGTDLSKAPKNPVFDVRYYKGPNNQTMFITHINGKPMTPVPEGFKPVTAEEAQKVGMAADEEEAKKKAATTQQESSYEFAPGDPGTWEEQSARNKKLDEALTTAAKALPFVGAAKKATEFFMGKPRQGPLAPVEIRTPTPVGDVGRAKLTDTALVSMAEAAAEDAYSQAKSAGLSDTFAEIASSSASSQVQLGVDPARAVRDALEAAQMDAYTMDTSRTGPSSSSRSYTPSSTMSPTVSAEARPVESREVQSRSLDLSGDSSIGTPETGSGAGVSPDGETREYSPFAQGGFVGKRQYPTKKKKGKGIASSKK